MQKEKINKLLKTVPISSLMQIEAGGDVGKNSCFFSLKAPLSTNQNDKNTAFAGSIYSLAALTGWSYLSLLLEENSIDAFGVLYKAEVKYQKPILTDFQSICPLLSDKEKKRIFSELKEQKKTRVLLNIDIVSDNDKKAYFSNLYVLKLKK